MNIWLWPEAGQFRVFSPHITRVFSGKPDCIDALGQNQCLREQKRNTALTQIRHPAEFGRFLLDIVLSSNSPLELRLTSDLPDEWRDIPFEWLDCKGKALQEYLLVARDVPRPGLTETPVCTHQGVILNLWPGDEPIQPARGLVARQLGLQLKLKEKIKPVEAFMATENLHDYGLLIVVAHGSEGMMEQPFRLSKEDKNGWTLPTGRGLPDLVILLACGSENGNLLEYGRSLLRAGAKTVLAPRGQLDAERMKAFLDDFLEHWLKQGQTVAQALHQTQRDDQDKRTGAARLYLLGEPDLSCRPQAKPLFSSLEQLKTQVEAELKAGHPALTLPVWCERLTLDHYQRDGNLDTLELNREMDETLLAPLLNQLYPVRDTLPHLTRLWVIPGLAYLAENHNHTWLEALQDQRTSLEQSGRDMTPSYYRHWAKVYYRQGRYPLSVRDKVKGLNLLQTQENPQHGLGLTGSLLDDLIDQVLIQPALKLESQLDLSLSLITHKQTKRDQRNAKGRKARLALRQGNPEKAYTLYKKRWKGSSSEKPDERALVWLLYTIAWYPVKNEQEYLQQGLAVLNATHEEGTRLPGNNDFFYMLRALAAWVWCRDDHDMALRLASFIPLCRERLDDPDMDVGPPGFILAYLFLYAEKHQPDWQKDLPSWISIMTHLEEQRYYLEQVAFCAMHGDHDQAEVYLDKFQDQRKKVVNELKNWQWEGFNLDWNTL
ncbi:MAG: CHAT domain-containing protein, partial [Methylococcaceae bacterium]